MYLSIAKLAEKTKGVISAAGIKKAAVEGRIKAKKQGRNWVIDTKDPKVSEWLDTANTEDQSEEVRKLKRDLANLGLRVRQAEAAQRRAESKVRKLEAELAQAYKRQTEQADEAAQRIHDVTITAIEQSATSQANAIMQLATILAKQQGQPRQIITAETEQPPVTTAKAAATHRRYPYHRVPRPPAAAAAPRDTPSEHDGTRRRT